MWTTFGIKCRTIIRTNHVNIKKQHETTKNTKHSTKLKTNDGQMNGKKVMATGRQLEDKIMDNMKDKVWAKIENRMEDKMDDKFRFQ